MQQALRILNMVFSIVGASCLALVIACLIYANSLFNSIDSFKKRLAAVPTEAPELSNCNTVQDCYLNLLKKQLVRYDTDDYVNARLPEPINSFLASHNLALDIVLPAKQMNKVRVKGNVWPYDQAETMIGLRRLDNIEYCIRDILKHNVPGDLIETGVWRGGATIYMRAVLKAYGDNKRKVWLADSFQGLPKPDAKDFPTDAEDKLWRYGILAVSADDVKRNFARYGLLDDQIRFLPGWFRDTLPHAPIDKLAILRLDGDMYESTMESLRYLYQKVSPGGYIIVDDYGVLSPCRKAIEDFRASQRITSELKQIDWSGVYWQKK